MTQESWSALAVLLLLCACAAVGCVIRPRLPEQHRDKQTIDMMHHVISMQVTFAGLALGLLITSAKTGFNVAYHDRQQYALQLTDLDQCLRNYAAGGPAGGSTAARVTIRDYTAAVIASTWPDEPHPTGFTYPDTLSMAPTGENPVLTSMLNQLDLQLRHLSPGNNYQSSMLPDCQSDFRTITAGHWAVIEDLNSSTSVLLYWILVFWLTIVFTSLGLVAPRNTLVLVGIGLAATSLSLAVFVIADLSQPYGGAFSIPSTDMRTALAQMMAP